MLPPPSCPLNNCVQFAGAAGAPTDDVQMYTRSPDAVPVGSAGAGMTTAAVPVVPAPALVLLATRVTATGQAVERTRYEYDVFGVRPVSEKGDAVGLAMTTPSRST